jgi:two-component system sensor histidine kinase RpfC
MVNRLAAAPDERVWVRFNVIDTGIGLSDEAQKHIFESFVQADASITRKYGGTGLGTAISRELATLMGGRIGLESEEGKGTMFWFELPFDRQPYIRKEELAVSSFTGTSALLLLGEDVEPEVKKFLERWGVEYETVAGTAQLFSRLVFASEHSRPFRAVIVERELLGLDATQFAASIREDSMLSGVSLILIDSRHQAEDQDPLMMSYSAVLYKPVNESLLFNAIHETCADHKLSKDVASLADYFRKREEAHGLRILLAEDNEVNQDVLRAILEHAGHLVHIAEDGEEALDILTERDTDFDFLILDMNMPKVSGLDVLKAYRFMETAMDMPVIMLSANALAETIEECREAGADEYLTKPVDAKSLIEAIDRLSRTAKAHVSGGADIQQFPVAEKDTGSTWRFIDVETLDSLRGLSSRQDFLQGLLGQFIDDGNRQLAGLRAASSASDQAAFLRIVHDFKGSAATAGVNSVAQVCGEAESRPPQELHRSVMAEFTDRISKVFQGASRELNEYLGLPQH